MAVWLFVPLAKKKRTYSLNLAGGCSAAVCRTGKIDAGRCRKEIGAACPCKERRVALVGNDETRTGGGEAASQGQRESRSVSALRIQSFFLFRFTYLFIYSFCLLIFI